MKKENSNEKEIFSENPEKEQWNLLEIYSYENNIKKYFLELHSSNLDDEKINNISNAILQAKEYFFLATKATLFTQPVLLYYGYINLLSALYILKKGKIANIENHGMRIEMQDNNVGNIKVGINNTKTGALSNFSTLLSDSFNIDKYKNLTLKELLSTIPDILEYYLMTYQDKYIHLLPLDEIEHKSYVEDRVDVKYIKYLENGIDTLDKCKNIKKNYLPIIQQDGSRYVFLRRKITYEEDVTLGINNKRYINLEFNKDLIIDQKISRLMILYALSVLCRYYPNIWNQFVKSDNSGEKLLIQSFLNNCIRIIPNDILNIIENKVISFTSKKQERFIAKTNDSEIKEIIDEYIDEYLKKGNK